jgi:hypothetical protein
MCVFLYKFNCCFELQSSPFLLVLATMYGFTNLIYPTYRTSVQLRVSCFINVSGFRVWPHREQRHQRKLVHSSDVLFMLKYVH